MRIKMNKILKQLEKKEKTLDRILQMSREIVRMCSKGIKLIHQKKFTDAKNQINKIKEKLKKLKENGIEFDHYYRIAEQEYSEFVILYSLVMNKSPPDYQKLNVHYTSYLNGMMDCIGELRRYMLDSIKKEDLKTAERMFNLMEELYDITLPLNFSNSLLPNFRQKQDVARRQIEFARSELTYALISMKKLKR